MTTARYRSLLRTVYTSILASRLSAAELRALSEELRRGRFADELAYMLDRVTEHFRGVESEDIEDDRLMEAEQLIRRNKISKIALASIFESLGFHAADTKDSSRDMLRRFISEVPTSRTSKLLDILRSAPSGDSFLAGISESRK